MKIYNEIVFDVDGNVTYEDSYEYSGDVALCISITDYIRAQNEAQKDGIVTPEEQQELAKMLATITGQTTEEEVSASATAEVLNQEDGGLAQASEQFNIRKEAERADVQSTPLPSLPSISNVGSVPFTGTVSNIPGGFQPLPQVAGGKKKLYQLSQFHGGINQKSSPRDISDQECQSAINIAFSNIGRITLLGDCLNENNALKEFSGITAGLAPNSGYGLFEFTAPADPSGAVLGEQVILLSSEFDQIIALCDKDNDGDDDTTTGFMDFAFSGSNDEASFSPVFYAAGNGVYITDADFSNTGGEVDTGRAKIYVSRIDINGIVPVSGWTEGKSLIDSPTYNTTAGDTNSVDLQTAHVNSGANGRMEVTIIDSATAGLWNGTYYFYVSWIFDGGCETGLTAIGTGDSFTNQALEFNVSIKHHGSSFRLGGDERIEGARIYFKKTTDSERFLLAEFSLPDGVKGALDSTFTPWRSPAIASDVYDIPANIIFDAPPEVYTYASLNGYYANEVYSRSFDSLSTDDTGPTAKEVRYKTAVVGSGGIVFIGNVKFDGRHIPDSMMFSMPGKPGLFPLYNRFDSPSSDGSPIMALAVYRDTILQFKKNGMYVINVSNPAQFYAQASFRDCGVSNPCQVFTASFGVIFVNKNGCYIYDGQRVTSLTDGKFNWAYGFHGDGSAIETSVLEAGDDALCPSIGYDPRSQNIIILRGIGDNATRADGFVYNMTTQSWTTAADIISNDNARRHTNFIITSEGYLSLKANNDPSLLNYNHDKLVDTGAQTITYWTKDFDFGFPSQSKHLFKVYITYKGDADSLTVKWGYDGETDAASDLDSFETTVGGGADTTPLLDKNSASDLEVWHIAELFPASNASGWYSMSIYMNGSVDSTFEINDISILYRLRPIK